MSKRTLKSQRGALPLIEVILIVAVVALIGVTGYKVYTERTSPKTSEQASEQSTEVTSSSEANKNFLVLKELGVKFELPQNNSDLIYKIREYTLSNGQKTVAADLTTSDLQAKGCDYGTEGTITRVDANYPESANVQNSGGQLMKQFEGFYIGFVTAQAPCAKDTTAKSPSEAQNDFDSFVAALKAVELN